MRIFVYEHITGGGLVNEALPPSLAHEGELMLRALLNDLALIEGLEVVLTRDERLEPVPGISMLIPIKSGMKFEEVLLRGFTEAEAVWPIAPETEGVLTQISRLVESAGLHLFGSSAAAVEIASSKYLSAATLSAYGILVVQTCIKACQIPQEVNEIVVKPDDGAGCLETKILMRDSAEDIRPQNSGTPSQVFQPYVHGRPISLSLLCVNGEATVLSCNEQHVTREEEKLLFGGVTINSTKIDRSNYSPLANEIARAIPGLWGYVGIDLIETSVGPLVVDVNPRLTTSYAGISQALGINIAELILGLGKEPLTKSFPIGQEVVIRTKNA